MHIKLLFCRTRKHTFLCSIFNNNVLRWFSIFSDEKPLDHSVRSIFLASNFSTQTRNSRNMTKVFVTACLWNGLVCVYFFRSHSSTSLSFFPLHTISKKVCHILELNTFQLHCCKLQSGKIRMWIYSFRFKNRNFAMHILSTLHPQKINQY